MQAEQNAIRKANDEGNRPLSWSQTRKMPVSYKVCTAVTITNHDVLSKFLFWYVVLPQGQGILLQERLRVGKYGFAQVVLESLRIASIISFTFREAVADVEYKGKRRT